jgi:ubiquitin-conjugating enzyme E2 D/E
VTITTKIYHPNVESGTGAVRLSLLGRDWSPVCSVECVLSSLVTCLGEPDLQAVVMPQIACRYALERRDYVREAREWAEKFAM